MKIFHTQNIFQKCQAFKILNDQAEYSYILIMKPPKQRMMK